MKSQDEAGNEIMLDCQGSDSGDEKSAKKPTSFLEPIASSAAAQETSAILAQEDLKMVQSSLIQDGLIATRPKAADQ